MLPAQRFLVAVTALYATWAVARFLAVGVGHRLREADRARQPPPGLAEVDAWRQAVRRELHTRWVGALSPLQTLAAAPVARFVAPRPAIGQEPGLHVVVGPTGTGTSATLWRILADALDDPRGPIPVLVDAARLAARAQPGPAGREPEATGSPELLDQLVVAELTDLTGMPQAVAERLVPEVVLLVDGFEAVLASSPGAASSLLGALGAWPDATGGLNAVAAIARASRQEEAAPARRIVVATTPAGYEAFVRAGLAGADGPLVTVTHLEPADEAAVRAAIAGTAPPRPGLAAALDRLPALAPLLGHPLWLDVALDAFATPPRDRDRPGLSDRPGVSDRPGLSDRPGGEADDRVPAGTGPLDHLPATASSAEIEAALWEGWLARRLARRPDARRFAAQLARRHPARSQPTFHLHQAGRSGAAALASWEGMSVGAGATVLASGLLAAAGSGWGSVVVGLLTALGAGAAFGWVLRRHVRRTGRLGPVGSGPGAGPEDGDGPALAGVTTGLIVMALCVGPALLVTTRPPVVLLLWPLLIAVPVAVAGWLGFRARLGVTGSATALLALGAFGGVVGLMGVGAPAGFSVGVVIYPFPGDPAELLSWWTAALIVGPLVGVVDGFGLAGPGPVRFDADRAVSTLARSGPYLVAIPVIGSVLVSGAVLLGVLVQPALVAFLLPFAVGGIVVGLAVWLVGAVDAGFVPYPERRPSTDPAAALIGDARRAVVRALVAVVVTAAVGVPAGWIAGSWLSGQPLGPALGPGGFARQEVPMVRPVLAGVALALALWLFATLVTTAPRRQRLALAVAAARGRAPRHYPAFLDELVAAGVLHRCGAGYRFRHPSLADHLAGPPALQPAEPRTPPDAFDPAPSPVAV